LDTIIENTKLKIIQPTKIHPLKLWGTKTKLEMPWEFIWDPTKNKFFLVPWDCGDKSTHQRQQNWSIIEMNWWIVSISGEGTFGWSTKHAILKDEYFGWGGIPWGNFGNPFFNIFVFPHAFLNCIFYPSLGH
jgi:hypothetical protein